MTAARSSRRPLAATASVPADPLAFAALTRPRRVRAELVAGILRGGRVVPDDTFDEIYPEPIRSASTVHWTPVRVCKRVLELLDLQRGERLLDVGAGAGKFCIVAAAMSRALVRGVEREPRLVEVGREAARRLGVEVDLREAEFANQDMKDVDAVYFFNPFAEAILLPGVEDFGADRRAGKFGEDVVAAERLLAEAHVGLRLVTFCGFGGTVPSTYERLAEEAWDGGVLELWVKRAARSRTSSSATQR